MNSLKAVPSLVERYIRYIVGKKREANMQGNEQHVFSTRVFAFCIYRRAHSWHCTPEDSENILAELLAENADLHARLAELQGLYEKVYKLDQLKSCFFVTINHELRTLLS